MAPTAGGHLREYRAQHLTVDSVAVEALQCADGVRGELGPGPEVAVAGVRVGEGEDVGIGVLPHRVERRNHPQHLFGGHATEFLPHVHSAGQHRFAGEHVVAIAAADEHDRDVGAPVVPQVPPVFEAFPPMLQVLRRIGCNQ